MSDTIAMLAFVLRYRLTIWRRSYRTGHGLRALGPELGALIYLVIGGVIALFAVAITTAAHRSNPGNEAALLILPLAAMAFALLLSGISIALNELFVASDVELLLTAPLSSGTLFLLKLFDCARPALPATGWSFAALAGFAAALGLGAGFYVAALVVSLLLALCLALASVSIVLLLARVIPPRRLRDAVLFISGLAGVTVWLLWYGGRRSFNQSTIDRVASLRGRFGWTPVGWATSALSGAARASWSDALGYGLALLAFIAAAGVVSAVLFSRVFLPGWSASREVPARRRSRRQAGGGADRSVAFSIAWKDWITLRRDVPYLSSLVPSLLYAVVYPFLLIRLGTSNTLAGRWLGIAGLPLVPVLAASSLALTAISREGASFDVLRSAPVSASRVIAGKVLGVAVPLAALTAVAGAVLAAFHSAPLPAFAVAIAGGLWLGAGCSAIGVSVGTLNPKFDMEPGRRRPSLSSGGCVLYAALAGLFAGGNALLVTAIVAVAIGKAAVPLLTAGLVLFLAALATLAAVVVAANRHLAGLLGPED